MNCSSKILPRGEAAPTADRAICGRIVALIAVCAAAAPVWADDELPDWQPYFRELAQSYRILPESSPDEPLELLEPPVLRWSQPVRGGDDGALYIWLRNGEPAVVGTMFCWPHAEGYRVVVNEFHSLLPEPLTAERDGATAWEPREAGIEWKAFEVAPAPAATAPQRLRQLRLLSQRFRGENFDDSNDKKWELRLLPQPLHRFDRSDAVAESGGALDGALFTLASGTDPEIMILIAARPKADAYEWQWALARFSDRPLTAWLDDVEVFSVERAQPARHKPHTYFDVARLVQPPEPQEDAE